MPAAATPCKPARVKPRLRGVSHELTFYFGLAGAVALIGAAPPGRATVAAAIYALSFVTLFGISALYHRPMWAPAARARLRRLDHSAIYLLIAGTYTPVALLAVPPDVGTRLLLVVWIGAGLGVLQSVAWSHAPRPLRAALYVLLGWAVVGEWSAVSAGLGTGGIALLAAGGGLYSLGAVVYATRRPDPAPAVFGYHEVFHLLVVAAAGCHAGLVLSLLAGAG